MKMYRLWKFDRDISDIEEVEVISSTRCFLKIRRSGGFCANSKINSSTYKFFPNKQDAINDLERRLRDKIESAKSHVENCTIDLERFLKERAAMEKKS